jgi:hypothetical protein
MRLTMRVIIDFCADACEHAEISKLIVILACSANCSFKLAIWPSHVGCSVSSLGGSVSEPLVCASEEVVAESEQERKNMHERQAIVCEGCAPMTIVSCGLSVLVDAWWDMTTRGKGNSQA